MTIINIGFYAFCFLFITCTVHKRDAGSRKYNPEKIVLRGIPSNDTISITFYKKGTWFVMRELRSRLSEKPTSEPCFECETTFTKPFIDTLMNLQTENISDDCRITKDTLIDGQPIAQITDFYRFSDLLRETISLTGNNNEVSISYLEPRTALPYCKDNKNRLEFIRFSNTLRSIR